MKPKYMMISFFLSLTSCIEVRDPDKGKSQNSVTSQAEPTAEVRPLPQAQRYGVHIVGADREASIFRRSSAKVQALAVEGDDVVEEPGVYEYTVQQAGKTYKLHVEIPEDLIVSGSKTLDQFELFLSRDSKGLFTLETKGRLYFQAGGSITTEGKNVKFVASSIESEGGQIQTLSPNLVADIGNPGRSGGLIILESPSLRGTLHMVMRGEKGGDGEGNTLMKPADQVDNNGRNGGNSGLLQVHISDLSRGDVTFDLFPGAGGAGVVLVGYCFLSNCPNTILKGKGTDGLTGVAQKPEGLN